MRKEVATAGRAGPAATSVPSESPRPDRVKVIIGPQRKATNEDKTPEPAPLTQDKALR
jgi:hypothetical protein